MIDMRDQMLEIPTSHMLCRRTNTINNKHGENHHIYNTQCVKPPRITTPTCSTEQYGIVDNNRNVTLLGAIGNNGERRNNLVLATVMLRACHRGHLVETDCIMRKRVTEEHITKERGNIEGRDSTKYTS